MSADLGPEPASETERSISTWQQIMQGQARARAKEYADAIETFLREALAEQGVTDPLKAAAHGFELEIRTQPGCHEQWILKHHGRAVAERHYP